MHNVLRPKNLIAALAISAGFLGAQAGIASAATGWCDSSYCYSQNAGWTVSAPAVPVSAPAVPVPAPSIVVTLPLWGTIAPTTYCTPTYCSTR